MVGIGLGHRDPFDFSATNPCNCECCPTAARSSILRPRDVRAATCQWRRAAGRAGKCAFRWGELCGPRRPHCPIPTRPPGRLGQPRTAHWPNRSRARCATAPGRAIGEYQGTGTAARALLFGRRATSAIADWGSDPVRCLLLLVVRGGSQRPGSAAVLLPYLVAEALPSSLDGARRLLGVWSAESKNRPTGAS